jgi:hypothetical protein
VEDEADRAEGGEQPARREREPPRGVLLEHPARNDRPAGARHSQNVERTLDQSAPGDRERRQDDDQHGAPGRHAEPPDGTWGKRRRRRDEQQPDRQQQEVRDKTRGHETLGYPPRPPVTPPHG